MSLLVQAVLVSLYQMNAPTESSFNIWAMYVKQLVERLGQQPP